MSLGNRLGALGAVGVGVAGLALAGWWALLAAMQPAGDGLVHLWLPLSLQLALTLALAAGVAWQLQRLLQPLHDSLRLLRAQAQALEQGRFVVVEDPPLADLVPLARCLNAAVRRLQSRPDPAASAAAPRRAARAGAGPGGIGSRFGLLRRLGDRLASRDSPPTALVALRRPAGGADDTALLVAARAEIEVEPEAFAGWLSSAEFVLCLPRHGEAAVVADRLRVAAGAGWQLAQVDELAGASLDAALAALDAAWPAPGAQDDDEALAQPAQVAEALRQGRLRLGAFAVVDRDGRLLHLECPLRLQPRADGRFEPAARWLGAAVQGRLTAQVDLAGIDLALQAIRADGVGRCVHVAADSLAAAEFVDAVRTRLQAAPDAAARLWIEVDEVSLERVPASLPPAATAWRRCGARVGVEHAGAALRSLLGLHTLEIDYVKVAQRYVQGLAADAEQRDWARALAAFVHDAGAQVFAEGVDSGDDLGALWHLGFDGATGRAVSASHAANQAMSPA